MVMKRMNALSMLAAVAVVLALGAFALAEGSAKQVTGKATCGGCSGVCEKCSVMLTDTAGTRWVLTGDSESLKKAFEVRHSDKQMTATLAGEAVTKKGKDGKDYKEVKVSQVTIAK
jgi:hypothetical protein